MKKIMILVMSCIVVPVAMYASQSYKDIGRPPLYPQSNMKSSTQNKQQCPVCPMPVDILVLKDLKQEINSLRHKKNPTQDDVKNLVTSHHVYSSLYSSLERDKQQRAEEKRLADQKKMKNEFINFFKSVKTSTQ